MPGILLGAGIAKTSKPKSKFLGVSSYLDVHSAGCAGKARWPWLRARLEPQGSRKLHPGLGTARLSLAVLSSWYNWAIRI